MRTREMRVLAKKAARLRADGKTNEQIAAELGVSNKTAWDLLADPDGSRADARREKYRQRRAPKCDICGEQTSDPRSARCLPCVNKSRHEEGRARIVAEMQRWAALYGCPPTQSDWGARLCVGERRELYKAGGWPCFTMAHKLFGSWSAAMVAAGFEPRPAHRPRSPA